MKDTKSNHKTAYSRSRKKKKSVKNSDFSFFIQMILLIVVIYSLVFAGNVTHKISNNISEVIEVENDLSLNGPVSNEISSDDIIEIETEPIDESPLPLEIHQINVGQANAYLIRHDNFTIFVDGGRTKSYPIVQKYLENFGVENVDMYIATHWHGDHVENMNSILRDYGHEQTIFYGTTAEPTTKYDIPETPYIQMVHGTSFNVGDVGFLCVGPDEIAYKGRENPDSLNLLIQHNDFKFLMTGDYFKDAAIESYGEYLKDVDILQMPHHGLQPFRISEEAMLYCNPEVMLVPIDNSYDSRHFLKTLGLETEVYDNKDGCIAIVSYGDDYEVYTNVKSPYDLV